MTADRASPLERASFVVLGALFLLMAIHRVPPVDIPILYATGRWIVEHGAFPTTNTFSWTFPDHPLHQQYPLFQVATYELVERVGWPAYSVAAGLAWTLVLAVWMRWAGRLDEVRREPLLWLVVMIGVQRHLVQRPEVFTLLGMGLMLVILDRWRAGARGALVALPLVQWVMVNTHQLYPLGLAVQLVAVGHFVAARWLGRDHLGDPDDAEAPLRPLLLAVLGSLLVLPLSPLGLGVYLTPFTTIGTVLAQGAGSGTGPQSTELQPVFSDPFATAVVVVLGAVLVFRQWRARRVDLIELGVAGLGLVLVALAQRGIPFYALGVGAVAVRLGRRAPALLPEGSIVRPLLPVTAGLVALILGSALVREPHFLSAQFGLGRTRGEWADAAMAHLRADPPPGRMMNLGWAAANHTIYAFGPELPAFVDPRWETYPRDFLTDAISSKDDPALLAALIERWRPGWLLVEMRLPEAQQRLVELLDSGDWALVYVDSLLAIAVRDGPEQASWLASRRLAARDIAPTDWSPEGSALRAQEEIRVARLLRWLGEPARAEALFDQARRREDHPVVASELARWATAQ